VVLPKMSNLPDLQKRCYLSHEGGDSIKCSIAPFPVMCKPASNRSCNAPMHTPATLSPIHQLQAEGVVESRSDRDTPQPAPTARLREPTRVWLSYHPDKTAAIIPYSKAAPTCEVDDMFGLTITLPGKWRRRDHMKCASLAHSSTTSKISSRLEETFPHTSEFK
jgi:hypothetical protein